MANSVDSAIVISSLGPCLTILGTVIVAVIVHFIAEDYRRFRDANALAAGLAGELSSYGEAYDLLQKVFVYAVSEVEAGRTLPIRDIQRPEDFVLDAFVSKLGFLDVEVIQDVVYVYHQIGAFRTGFKVLATENEKMEIQEIINRVTACKQSIERAHKRAEPLLPHLRMLAGRVYLRNRFFGKIQYQSARSSNG